jgi:hypothetical protein
VEYAVNNKRYFSLLHVLPEPPAERPDFSSSLLS